jgi:hypothetical protein
VKLNFGEPLGSWADELPREYVDLILQRRASGGAPGKLEERFHNLFEWDNTPEGRNFWDVVDDFTLGHAPRLPGLPASEKPTVPTHSLGVMQEKPLTTAEQVARIEKKLAEQDALLASISKLIADFNATNS